MSGRLVFELFAAYLIFRWGYGQGFHDARRRYLRKGPVVHRDLKPENMKER